MKIAADATVLLQGVSQVLNVQHGEEISLSAGTSSCQDTEQGPLMGYSVRQSLSSGFIFRATRVCLYAIILAYGTWKHMEAIFFNYIYLKLKVNSRHFYKLLHGEIKCLYAVKLQRH